MTRLILARAGGPATESNNQGDKSSVSGATITGGATVTCYGKKYKDVLGGSGFVPIGGSFTVPVDGSEHNCVIQQGTQRQTAEIHVSCSAPLSVGDRFGALTVTDMQLEGGRSPADFCPPCVICCNMGEIRVPAPVVEECDGMGNRGQLQHFIDSAQCSCSEGT